MDSRISHSNCIDHKSHIDYESYANQVGHEGLKDQRNQKSELGDHKLQE